jgi:hypothetical protein
MISGTNLAERRSSVPFPYPINCMISAPMLINQAMQAQRERYLRASAIGRTDERRGYATASQH